MQFDLLKRLLNTARSAQTDPSDPWGAASRTLIDSLCAVPAPASRVELNALWRGAVEPYLGYFTQFATFRGRHALQAIVDDFSSRIARDFGPDALDGIDDAAIHPASNLAPLGSRRVSPDALRFAWYWLRFVEWAGVALRPEPIFVEIGSGYAGFARTLLQRRPSARIVLIDLPASLSIAAMYLMAETQAPLHFAETEEEARRVLPEWLERGGVLLALPEAAPAFAGLDADALFNFYSLAEVSNGKIAGYYEIFGVKGGARRFFTFNTIFARPHPAHEAVLDWGDWLFQARAFWSADNVGLCDDFHATLATGAFVPTGFLCATAGPPSHDTRLVEVALEAVKGCDLIFRSVDRETKARHGFTPYLSVGDVGDIPERPIRLDAAALRVERASQNLALAFGFQRFKPLYDLVTLAYLRSGDPDLKAVLQTMLRLLANTGGETSSVLREEAFLDRDPAGTKELRQYKAAGGAAEKEEAAAHRDGGAVRFEVQEACDIAALLARSGHRDEARKTWRAVAEAAPRHAEARFQLAWLCEDDEADEALALFAMAADLYPGHENYRTAPEIFMRARRLLMVDGKPVAAQQVHDRGVAAHAVGDEATARRLFATLVAAYPDYAPAVASLSASYVPSHSD